MRKTIYFIIGFFVIAVLLTIVVSNISIASAVSGQSNVSDVSLASQIDAVLDEMPDEHWNLHLERMPDTGCVKLRVNPPAGPLRKWFCDSNYLHYAAGLQYGIEPISSIDDVWNIKRPLVKIRSCAQYLVDSLTHSHPYLVPEAAKLLSEIGQAFNDSLRTRGGGCYRLKVTSVLRTEQSIRRLRRVNRVAVEESSHSCGTSFDISYANFICDAQTVNRTAEDLKNLLAEIVYDFRSQGRCLAIFERGQGCFHITYKDGNYRRPLPPPEDEKKHH